MFVLETTSRSNFIRSIRFEKCFHIPYLYIPTSHCSIAFVIHTYSMTTMPTTVNVGPASSRSDDHGAANSSTPVPPSQHPSGEPSSKRKRPAAPTATNNQFLVDNVNAYDRRYTNYPLNRTMSVDPNIAAAQLRAANSTNQQRGGGSFIDQRATALLPLPNPNFARAQHPQQ